MTHYWAAGRSTLPPLGRRGVPRQSEGGDAVVSYTPEQRRMIRKGLRILARVAIRSYMRKHAARSQAGSEEG